VWWPDAGDTDGGVWWPDAGDTDGGTWPDGGSGTDGGTWPDGGTDLPITNHVVISEFAAEGPGSVAADEFIELYNPTPYEVDLSGWKLQYKSATGLAYTGSFTFPDGSKIASRGYFLVTAGGYVGSVSGDESWLTSFNLAAAAGHVRLGLPDITTSPTDPLAVDTVGYGSTATHPEGSAFLSRPPASGSFERKARATSTSDSMQTGSDSLLGNGYDSNNNATDFVLRSTRQPQNRSSPLEP
jgi:hypothetical protein